MTCGIYEIVNTVNGKRYVGSSVDIHKRWLTHLRQLRKGTHHAQHLQRSFDKYGEDCFDLRTVLECDRADLILNEQSEMSKGYDYNSSPTAQSTLGLRFSEDARGRVRQNRLDRYAADPIGYSAAMSAISKGKPKSKEWRENASIRSSGVKKSIDHVEKMARSRAVIDEATIREIRDRCDSGEERKSVAISLGLKPVQVQRIANRQRYKWVK